MRYLAKAGFTQSYTYFTWRTTKAELTDYFTELTATDVREYLRPNLFTNTPDILHAFLQHGGRPAFEIRLLLAATLGASYGIYSGFELCEGARRRWHGGVRRLRKIPVPAVRDWNQPGHIKALVARVNAIRRAHRALQFDRTLQFHETDNPEIIAYSKATVDRAPAGRRQSRSPSHAAWTRPVPRSLRKARPRCRISSTACAYTWRGDWNYVRLDPGVRQGHIFQI